MLSKLVSKIILPAQYLDPFSPCDNGVAPIQLTSAYLDRLSIEETILKFVFQIVLQCIQTHNMPWDSAYRQQIKTVLAANSQLDRYWKKWINQLVTEICENAPQELRLHEDANQAALNLINSSLDPHTLQAATDKLTQATFIPNPQKVDIISNNVKTADGDWIRVYKLTPENFDPATISSKRIAAELYFQPNATHAEELENLRECAKLAAATGIVVYSFNYRNVGSSYNLNQAMSNTKLPCSLNTLREDGLAAFNYILSDGIPSGKIELRGRSLGGVVATEVAHALRNKVNLSSCPYLTTQQTLSTFIRVIIGHLIGSNAKYYYGYLDPTNLYFKGNLPTSMADTTFNKALVFVAARIANLMELAIAKPLLLAITTLTYIIAKSVLTISGWGNRDNGYKFMRHPREKRRNLYNETPQEVLQKDCIANNHVDDNVIRPIAALENSLYISIPKAVGTFDQHASKRIQANQFYNLSEKENHQIENGHDNYQNLKNITHGDNINQSVVSHIKSLNGDSIDPISDYYPATAASLETKTSSLPAPSRMRLNNFLEDRSFSDEKKASTLIKDIIKQFENETVIHPAYIASTMLSNLEIILSYATTQSFVLALYKELLNEAIKDGSLVKSVLIDRRSGLFFSNSSRFKATVDFKLPAQEVTKTFALIQQNFHTRLLQLPTDTSNPPSFIEAQLSEDIQRNTYSIKDSFQWMLFGNNKSEQMQPETENLDRVTRPTFRGTH